jgi:hypothetical protein
VHKPAVCFCLKLGLAQAVDGGTVASEGAATASTLHKAGDTGSVTVDTEVDELGEGGGEVLEEELLVGGVLLDPGAELLVLNEGNLSRLVAAFFACMCNCSPLQTAAKSTHVSGKHHEPLANNNGLVLEGTVPLARNPLPGKEELEVLVGEASGVDDPGAGGRCQLRSRCAVVGR